MPVVGKTEGLYFREDTKDTPAAMSFTQDQVASPGLTMRLYRPGAAQLKKSHHEEIKNDPHYIWSGNCKDRWAVTFLKKALFADLSGPHAAIRFRTKNFKRTLFLVLKTDGHWVVRAVDGYQFSEGATPVCFYHTRANTFKGKWSRADYVHPLMGLNGVDFQNTLKPIAGDVKIGGADNEKGYGGFSARIPLPADLKMIGPGGPYLQIISRANG